DLSSNGTDKVAPPRPGGARLGVTVVKPTEALANRLNLPRGQGLLITEVNKDSPAARAGLKANDVLVEFAGKAVPSSPAEVAKVVKGFTGDKADVVVLREGKRETFKGVTLSQAKADGCTCLELVPVKGQPGAWQLRSPQGQTLFRLVIQPCTEGMP